MIAFGFMAQAAVALWPDIPKEIEPHEIPHPSNPEEDELLDAWRAAITDLRDIVTPDPDGDNSGPNYGSSFEESDYAPIPRRDLPFGAPAFLGDDAWVRAKPGNAMNSVGRPDPDDEPHADLAGAGVESDRRCPSCRTVVRTPPSTAPISRGYRTRSQPPRPRRERQSSPRGSRPPRRSRFTDVY